MGVKSTYKVAKRKKILLGSMAHGGDRLKLNLLAVHLLSAVVAPLFPAMIMI